MDSIVHIENERFIGRTNYRNGLLNSAIALGVKEVNGVAMLGKRYQGVKVTQLIDGIALDIKIYVEYGFNAADVCYHVQKTAMNVASSMQEKKVINVNVRIIGVTVSHMKIDDDAEPAGNTRK